PRGPGPALATTAPARRLIDVPAARRAVGSPGSDEPGWPATRPGFAAASPAVPSRSCPGIVESRGTPRGRLPAPRRTRPLYPATGGQSARELERRGRHDSAPTIGPGPVRHQRGPLATAVRVRDRLPRSRPQPPSCPTRNGTHPNRAKKTPAEEPRIT